MTGFDLVIGAVHRGTEKIVHGAVENQDIPGLPRLAVENGTDHDSGVSGNESARFDVNLDSQVTEGVGKQGTVFGWRRRRIFRRTVIDTKSAPGIDTPDFVAVIAQDPRQVSQKSEYATKGSEVHDLGADMDVDPHNPDAGQVPRLR